MARAQALRVESQSDIGFQNRPSYFLVFFGPSVVMFPSHRGICSRGLGTLVSTNMPPKAKTSRPRVNRLHTFRARGKRIPQYAGGPQRPKSHSGRRRKKLAATTGRRRLRGKQTVPSRAAAAGILGAVGESLHSPLVDAHVDGSSASDHAALTDLKRVEDMAAAAAVLGAKQESLSSLPADARVHGSSASGHAALTDLKCVEDMAAAAAVLGAVGESLRSLPVDERARSSSACGWEESRGSMKLPRAACGSSSRGSMKLQLVDRRPAGSDNDAACGSSSRGNMELQRGPDEIGMACSSPPPPGYKLSSLCGGWQESDSPRCRRSRF